MFVMEACTAIGKHTVCLKDMSFDLKTHEHSEKDIDILLNWSVSSYGTIYVR